MTHEGVCAATKKAIRLAEEAGAVISFYTDGVKWINESYQIPLSLISMGKRGSRAYVTQ